MTNQSISKPSAIFQIEKTATFADCYANCKIGKFYAATDISTSAVIVFQGVSDDAGGVMLAPIGNSCTISQYQTTLSNTGAYKLTNTSSTPIQLTSDSPISFPANLLRTPGLASTNALIVSNGGAVTANFDIRLGPTGTSSDPVISTRTNIAFSATLNNLTLAAPVRFLKNGSAGVIVTPSTTVSTYSELPVNHAVVNYMTFWSKSCSVSGVGLMLQSVQINRTT